MRAVLSHFPCNSFVRFDYERLWKHAPRNTRLVRNHENRHARLVEPSNGFGREWKNLQPADVIQITDFFANHAVAVEKHCRPQDAPLDQSDPPESGSLSRPAPLHHPCAAVNTSSTETRVMQRWSIGQCLRKQGLHETAWRTSVNRGVTGRVPCSSV